MENLLFNLQAGIKPRYEMLEGKKYLVVPMVMITEGVFNGSQGPLYYPESELCKFPAVWNCKPIVSYHPEINGEGVSACDPAILESHKVGLIMNTQWSTTKKKLKAEAWLDEEKLEKIDPKVLEAIRKGQKVEVSTGLFTDNEESAGHWNGRPYVAIAKNYRPDHLAILYDQKGSCSIADGAGLLANALNGGNFSIVTEQDLLLAIKASGHATNPVAAKKHIISQAQALGKASLIPDNWKLAGNVASFSDVCNQLQKCLATKNGKVGERWNGYIEDVYPAEVVYESEGELYSQKYDVNESNKVSLNGDATKVKRVTSYCPMTNNQNVITQSTTKEEPKMPTKEHTDRVERMVKNMGEKGTDAQKKILSDMDETTLRTFEELLAEKKAADVTPVTPVVPVVPVVAPVAAFNAKNMTTEDFIANAPPAIADILRNALATEAAQRQKLIASIIANARNPFKKEYLEKRTMEELEGIAVLATPPQQTNNSSSILRPNYVGAATGVTTNQQSDEEPLAIPVMNWDK